MRQLVFTHRVRGAEIETRVVLATDAEWAREGSRPGTWSVWREDDVLIAVQVVPTLNSMPRLNAPS